MITKLRQSISNLPPWLIFPAVSLFAFGLFVPHLGFYWDDWPIMFFLHNHNFTGLITYYSFDRPLAAYIAIGASLLAGSSIILWQIFLVVLRCLTAIAVWKALSLLLPKQTLLSGAAALLFLVYPGYDTQPMVSTYAHWTTYLFFFVSLIATGNALRSPKKRVLWTVIALISQGLNIFVLEFFVGLELIRPFYIGFILADSKSYHGTDLLKRTIYKWSPYIALLLLWFVWRFFFLTLPEEPHSLQLLADLRSSPLHSLVAYGKIALSDVLYLCLSVWAETGKLIVATFGFFFQSLWWLVVLIAVLLGSLFVSSLSNWKNDKNIAIFGMIFGAAAVIAGLIPVWVIGDAANTGGYGSHYLLGGLFGASIFVVSSLSLIPSKLAKMAFLSVLLALGIGRQIVVSNNFSNVWAAQRDFYWQLYWRAPTIKANTALMFFYAFSDYMHQSSTSMAINTLYPQTQGPEKMDYWTYDLRTSTVLKAIEKNEPLTTEYRRLSFQAEDSNSMLFLYKLQDSCVWVLSPTDISNNVIPSENRSVLAKAGDQRIAADLVNGVLPSEETFGEEEPHSWCYYFEKADLAAQREDWEGVIGLMNKANQANLKPAYIREYFPLIEAYAHLDKWELAESLTLNPQAGIKNDSELMCTFWSYLGNEIERSPQMAAALKAVTETLACAPD